MYLFNYRSNDDDDDFHSEGLDPAYEDPDKV